MHTQEKIEQYIRGELNVSQIDELWIEFLETPEWFDYLMTYIHLVAMCKIRKRDKA